MRTRTVAVTLVVVAALCIPAPVRAQTALPDDDVFDMFAANAVAGASISDDGRYVAVESDRELFQPPADASFDVFVVDRLTRNVTLASARSDGADVAGDNEGTAISGDGRYVAFVGEEPLLPGAPQRSVYVRDLQSGTTALASVGVTSGAYASAISDDGRWVAFAGFANSHPASDCHFYVRDMVAGVTTLLRGATSDDNCSATPISGDGRHVAFENGRRAFLATRDGAHWTVEKLPIPAGFRSVGVWMSDAGAVAYDVFRKRPRQAATWLYDPATGRARQIAPSSIGGFSDDGTLMVLNDTLVDVASGEPRLLPRLCTSNHTYVGSPNHGRVLYTPIAPDPEFDRTLPLALAHVPGSRSDAYRLVAADGGVFTYGGARYFGSAATLPLRSPIVAIASTATGNGYWLFAADGGVFSYGDARFHGSLGALRLRSPIVGAAPAPDGAGYWLVAADGGVFAFGSARFAGSLGALRLQSPIVGIAPTRTGNGYWLAARDGGVFAFGDARFAGSAAGRGRPPIAGIAATPRDAGYWLVDVTGAITGFGGAQDMGSLPGLRVTPAAPIVGVQAATDACGYRFAAADGGVFPFASATFGGSAGGIRLRAPIVAIG